MAAIKKRSKELRFNHVSRSTGTSNVYYALNHGFNNGINACQLYIEVTPGPGSTQIELFQATVGGDYTGYLCFDLNGPTLGVRIWRAAYQGVSGGVTLPIVARIEAR